jgi:hypothetical protein
VTHGLSAAVAAVVAAGALVAAGCGGGGGSAEQTTTATTTATTSSTTTTTAPGTAAARVYFLHEGKVWPVARPLGAEGVATSALSDLYAGPDAGERRDLKLSTAIPQGAEAPGPSIAGGVATIHLERTLDNAALAQLVYTLTQFPTVKAVDIDGKRYSRSDFEEQTPAILVESPLAWQHVGSPLRVTGTANTFEATFDYELADTDGRIVDSHFVTAASGSGTRGTFDFTTKPYTVPFSGVGSLIVFERSAKDGSRIHLVEIPLRMEK